MSTEVERRTQDAQRIPFEALVEVGGAVGPAFEAQAINVSEEGMQLRTAYLPEMGQPITCRFEASGQSVLASGEVVWTQQGGKGGEFGIRFTDMDPESIDALRKMCGVSPDAAPQAPGSKVRLHIDGLNSPMRARVRKSQRTGITVGSDLGFLQLGKDIELEDAESGSKRPARIQGVEVEIDPSARVPQLVVLLRYADVAEAAAEAEESKCAPTADPEIPVEEAAPVHARDVRDDAGDIESVQRASRDVKGAIKRGVSTIGPAFSGFAKRAKTTIALLAAKSQAAGEAPPRRTTAPAPGGGLHTAGRKVIRGETMNVTNSEEPSDDKPKFKMTKRKAAIGGAVLVATVLVALALKKPHNPPGADPTATTATALATSTAPAMPMHALPAPAAPVAANMAAPAGGGADEDMGGPGGEPGAAGEPGHKKGGKVTPFGNNGPVAHGNVLHLKMDGPIEQIEGAQQPTGFTVHIPGRKSIDAAGALASRDSRIASVKMTNDPDGVELTIAFKDGAVPSYQVRAKGSTLEIALAPVGKTVAKKPGAHADKPAHGHKKKTPAAGH